MNLTLQSHCNVCINVKGLDVRFGLDKPCKEWNKKHQKYYQKNKEDLIEKSRLYIKNNPEKHRQYNRIRYIKKKFLEQ